MKFRDDIDPANTWITSDTHFGHENIVGYCARPEDHDLIMIEQWRAHVPDDATVLHLGDLCYKGNSYFKNVVAPRLTGARKLLILGNHDGGRYSFYKACGFKLARPFYIEHEPHWVDCTACSGEGWVGGTFGEVCNVCDGRCMIMAPYRVEFDHYPRPEALAGDVWRVHGHIHNNGYYDSRESGRNDLIPFLRNHINVSVEQTRYRPVNLKLLLDAAILGKLPA